MPEFEEDAVLLAFQGGGDCPVQYTAMHEGREYYVWYRHGWIYVSVDDVGQLEQALSEDKDDGSWSEEETNAYLYLISLAVRAGTLETLKVPSKTEIGAHRFHRKGLHPKYRRIVCAQMHDHDDESCFSDDWVSARDVKWGKTGRRV